MIIIRFLRYIAGYVSFSGLGGFPERFVNLCTKYEVPLWNLKNRGGSISACTTIKGYKKIRQPSRRSGVKVRIEKKHGLPFFLFRNKVRKGLLAGIAIAVAFVAFLSNMIWTVSVEGNKSISDEQVIAVFEELGVGIGSFRAAVSPTDVAYEAAKRLDGVSWASLNIKGSRAEIVVYEGTPPPEFPDTATPCNIVASEDGVVTRVEANVGTEEVKSGDAVIKGDLLISGVIENLDKTETLKCARGKVFAKVEKTLAVQLENEVFLRELQEKNRVKLYFLGLEIPVTFGVGEENFARTEKYLSDGEINLPVGIIKEHSYSLQQADALPDAYKNVFVAEKYMRLYKEIFESGNIDSQGFSIDYSGQSVEFCSKIALEKEIGIQSTIFVEKN